MENEIKVGEYIRTKDGRIYQVDSSNDEWELSDIFYKVIVKHSPNLIDLIQCGDYVNGYCVAEIEKDKNGNITDICYEEEMEMQLYSVGDIESIVTKEHFEAISYKVERKD